MELTGYPLPTLLEATIKTCRITDCFIVLFFESQTTAGSDAQTIFLTLEEQSGLV